jgi:NAD(P)-dependent dehydrogenase (short-subunit alcohol dehydrogenase family)
MASASGLGGQVALVAGATRGAGRGIARMLGAAGATVYCTGRSSKAGAPLDPKRPETIEEAAELVTQEGGKGIAVRVDHTVEAQVVALVDRIKREQGRLDILVNDIWGGDALMDWSQKFWQIDIGVMRTLMERAVVSHLITARHAAPMMVEKNRGLIVEITDGHTNGYRGQVIYDLVKSSNIRLGYAMAWDLAQTGVTALALSPGFLRSEAVLDAIGVTEANWRDGIAESPEFAESETPCFIGRAIVALACEPNVRTKAGGSYFAADLADEYGFTDIDGRSPRFWPNFDRIVDQILTRGEPLKGQERFMVWARYCQIHRERAMHERAVVLASKLGIADSGAGLQPA